MKRNLFRGTLAVTGLVLGISMLVTACGSSESATGTAAEDSKVQSGSIVMSGLVDYPMTFVTLDTDYMSWVTVTAEDPQAGSVEYDGVSLSEVFCYVGVQSGATTVTITGYDGTKVELALADIGADALLTVTEDNVFDLIMPGIDSAAWVADVVTMDFK